METPPFLPDDFKDRRPWLIAFGALTILLGVFFLGFCGLSAVTVLAMGDQNPRAASSLGMVFVTYGGLAAAFVWLGIGSILCRRWARALLLVLSWMWLVFGVFSLGFMAFWMPGILRSARPHDAPAMPGSAETVILAVVFGFMAVALLVLPAVWVAFYSRRSVRLTCELRDSAERWTDRCPLPVLAISVTFACGVLFLLICPLTNLAVIPFFGTFLTGWSATAVYFGLAVLWAWLAWGLYKLKPAAWVISVVAFLLLGISTVMTYATHDVLELYRALGYPPEQIEQMAAMGFNGKMLTWMSAVSVVPWIGYLLFLGKYFRRPKLT